MMAQSEDCATIRYLNTVTFEVKYKDLGVTQTWLFHFTPDVTVFVRMGRAEFYLSQRTCSSLSTLRSQICFFQKDMEKQIIIYEEKKIDIPTKEWVKITNFSKNPLPASYMNSDNAYVRITLSVVPENSCQENIKREKGSKRRLSGSMKDSEFQLLETLSSDFEKYLDDKVNTDCVLKADGARIPAHRAVLSARSPVFKAMFQHETLEKNSGEVDIKDVSEAVLKDILYFMYAGTIHGLTSESAVEMFEAADLYDLPQLKKACLDFLLENLTVGNICSVACLAETYGLCELEAEVQRYVGENLEDVKKSDDWKQFFAEKPLIVNTILLNILSEKITGSRD